MPGGPSRKMEWVSHDLACPRRYEDGDRPRGAASLRQQMLAWRSAFIEASEELSGSRHSVCLRIESVHGLGASGLARPTIFRSTRHSNALARQ
jgi:hypothetical protein